MSETGRECHHLSPSLPPADAAYQAALSDVLGIVGQLAATAPEALVLTAQHGVTMRRLADGIALLDPGRLAVLKPFDPREAVTPKQAAALAATSVSSIRAWCERYRIGRRVVGSLYVSRVALAILLDDDAKALAAYLSGDRSSPVIRPYLDRVAA